MINDFSNKLLKLQYVSSGRFFSEEEWIHPKRVIESYEIIYVVEGCVYIQEEEERFILKKGEILILQPNKTHFGYQKSVGKTSFYWLHFLDCESIAFSNINQFICLEDNFQINLLFKQMLHVSNTPEYPIYTKNLILWLILTEIWVKQKENVNKCSPVLKNICEWVRTKADRKITVKEVANEFGYSEDYISRLFKKNFSLGIKEYIDETKMKTIKNLLLLTLYPMKQIAHEVGFNDYKSFLKYFKYHENISPMEYRKIYFNTHMNNK